MTTLGFLHTADIHVARFDALVRERNAQVATLHQVDAALLAEARGGGPTWDVQVGVFQHLGHLRDSGADVVVCTCSTLGAVAERHEVSLGIPVLRVDRPMARLAVLYGPRVGVIAALASTLQPTGELLHEEARRVGAELTVHPRLVESAWTAFESGDTDHYLSAVADAARAVAEDVDVIVLAQASMAEATGRLDGLGVPVLSSPSVAVDQALVLTPRSTRAEPRRES